MITIEHAHATGTVVHGTTRNDGTGAIFTNMVDSWRFSRAIGVEGAWHLPNLATVTRCNRSSTASPPSYAPPGTPCRSASTTHLVRRPRSRPTVPPGSPPA
ncbi:hypothetical protein ACFQX7_28270 [Luedemannella flava]